MDGNKFSPFIHFAKALRKPVKKSTSPQINLMPTCEKFLRLSLSAVKNT